MMIRKRMITLLVALALLCAFTTTAFAHDVPDTEKTGTIKIVMQTANGTTVPGGTLTIYRVGEVFEDDGNYSFILTGDFVNCGQSLEDVTSVDLAGNLAGYATEKSLAGTTKTIAQDGSVAFEDVELGLYLLVQNTAASGYNKADPFLVSVPMMEEGVYIYDVDASPKVEVERAPETTTPPPTKPSQPSLPHTGQLNWPIPILVVAGLALFCLGWVLCFRKKKQNEQ